MNPKKILGAAIFVVVIALGGFFAFRYLQKGNNSLPVADVQNLTGSKPSQDTGNKAGWMTYRSEYGGFSVLAPKDRASVGCSGKCGVRT